MRNRVGITTNPYQRQLFWQRVYPHVNITVSIVASGLTYEEAQEIENMYVANGYIGNPGGERVDGPVYYVYTFAY